MDGLDVGSSCEPSMVKDAYEEFGDLFMGTLAAAVSGVTREQVIARAKATFPKEDAFKEFLAITRVEVERQIVVATGTMVQGEDIP